MEFAGVHPVLVKGSSSNIKITGAEDLALATFILQQQLVGE
jgi:2-C-methyl-D-erythritol 4-phosphate cytidylyltransferase